MVKVVFDNKVTSTIDTLDLARLLTGEIEELEASDGSDVYETLDREPTIIIGEYEFTLDSTTILAEVHSLMKNVNEDNWEEFDNLNADNFFKFFEPDSFYNSLNCIMNTIYSKEYVDAIVAAMNIKENKAFASLGILNLINLVQDKNCPLSLCEYLKSLGIEEITYLADKRLEQTSSGPSPFERMLSKKNKTQSRCSGLDI